MVCIGVDALLDTTDPLVNIRSGPKVSTIKGFDQTYLQNETENVSQPEMVRSTFVRLLNQLTSMVMKGFFHVRGIVQKGKNLNKKRNQSNSH